MRRRIPLGLATVDTTHRFLLWAAASVLSVVTVGLILALRGTGTAILTPVPAMILASGTFVSSTCWWLAFFMPRGYRERVLGVQPEASPQGE